jgi:hypothetical protein
VRLCGSDASGAAAHKEGYRRTFASAPSASSAAVLGTCRVGRDRAKSAVFVADGTCRAPGLLFRAGFGPTFAAVADGADGIFERRAHPDYSASAFTTECNVDAERPQKCPRPTQVPGESARIFGPAGPVACLPAAFDANP